MQLTDLLHGALLLKQVDFPIAEVFDPERDLETAAFTVFLYGRMIGAAAEIDDHLNRGRNMDTRTPEAACAYVM